jgi:phosphatidylserine decarboxylase precursor
LRYKKLLSKGIVMKTSNDIIAELQVKLNSDQPLKELLLKSLEQANGNAKKELDPALYKALAWPITVDEYLFFLDSFSKWTPNQEGDAWKKPGYDQNQEVYDRLCHFHWLINQKITTNGSTTTLIVQNDPWFSKWLIEYANLWGSFLNTPESFNDTILESFIKKSPQYNVQNSMVVDPKTGNLKPNSPSGWVTFNQFFARELNPGLRPIDSPNSNTVICSPADCTFKATYDISTDSTINEIIIKKTHKFASIKNLLDGSPYQNDFANGTFVHSFLGPYDYHRFHTPVSGKVLECRPIQGLVYLAVNITDKQFDAPDSALDGYEFSQARGIIIIDTAQSDYGNIGKVAIVPIGMCQVSSVNMIATVNSHLLKGDEFGYFLFGGSDIIMLFQDGIDLKLNQKPVHHNYGTEVATCSALD